MAGFSFGGNRYMLDGVMGTAEDHAARVKKRREQAQYDAAAPSAGAANTAANAANPNLDFNVGATGSVTYNNQSDQQRRLEELKARLGRESDATRTRTAREDETRQTAQKAADRKELLALMAKQSGGRSAPVQHSGNSGLEADARAAAFARAKDQAGQIARASLTSIAEQSASRGVSGGGFQSMQEAGAIGGAGSSLIDVTRDQALSDAQRAGQIGDMTYQGGITQRGQDMAQRQSYLSLLRSLY